MHAAATAARAAAPPRPPGLPLLGHALDFTRDPLAFLLRVAREHGDFVELRFPAVRVYLVSDPASIERVLVTDARSYVKDRFTRDLRRVLDVSDALADLMDRYADPVLTLLPFLDGLPTPQGRRFWRAVERLDTILYRVLRARREQAPEARDTGDLLGMLLAARDEDGGRMTDRELRNELMTLFVAGHETTALALGWALYLLSENHAADAALAAELERELGERPAGLANLPRLRFTEAVILESMRLYPPVWGLGREAVAPVEIAGYHLPPGAQVWAAQWVVHRDPRWFDAPEAFRPERWLEERALRPKFAYFPFGGGPRLCIGQSFAMMEAVLVLATIARRFRLRLVPGHPIELFPSVTLRPRRGLRMTVEARRAQSVSR